MIALYHKGALLPAEQNISRTDYGRVQAYGTGLLDRLSEIGPAEWGLVLVAPFIGSFLGLLIQRLPEGSPVARGRSRCDGCGATLRVRDLVPILSWLMVGARCRYCGRPLGWFYPGVELAALAIALASVLIDDGRGAWLDCLLGWWLLALGWIDLRSWLLPDALTLQRTQGLVDIPQFRRLRAAARGAGVD